MTPTLPSPPTSVNVTTITTAHREEMQRSRARALDAWSVATALAEWLAATPGLDERQVSLAQMSERKARAAFESADRISAELDPDQTPVPEPIE